MTSSTTGRLRVLREPVDSVQDVIDVILVPGIGTASPEHWPFTDEEWLTAGTIGSGSGARILAYEYASPFVGAKPSWESVLMLGYNFLQHLSDAREVGSKTTNKPIVIVCHSLGGMLVKQALCVANKQFPRYGAIVNAIAGVIFLSTPHRYGDKTTAFTRFRDVFEATTGKGLKISHGDIEREGAILLDLADRFEAVSLRTPILTIYELKETKNTSTSLRSKYQQLVDRESCTTHAPLETVIGLNLNHNDTCLFTKSVGGEGLSDFNKFISETFRDATRLVALRIEGEEYQYATMSTYSPTLSEMPQIVEQLELNEWPSGKATEWPSNTSLAGFELISRPSSHLQVRKTLNLPCFLLNTHPANEDFCGRRDTLERLAAELLPPKNLVTASDTNLRQFALCGFGGIGKTEIAREFSRLHKDAFDAVFWVAADEIAKLDNHYQKISLALGLEGASECKSQVVSREIVKGWLSCPRKQLSESEEFNQHGESSPEATWLLIFDNADDPMVLADYWPQGSGSILITSRDPLAKSMFTSRPSGLDLSPLTQQDSLSLFNHLTTAGDEPEDEDDTAQKIAEALGGVPLAISQMAGIIRRQDLTLEEFLELYTDRQEHSSLYETKFETTLVKYQHSLATVWAFEKLKPLARQLLELISFLDPDNIGEDLLMTASVELFTGLTKFRKSDYIEARADLLQSSLVQRDKQKQHISVHRMVQDAIVATMDAAKKRTMFDQVVRILWADWPSAMPTPLKEPELPKPKSTGERLHVGRWPVCAAIYPHVLRIHHLWPAIQDASEAVGLQFAKLLNEAAWYQKERGRTKGFDSFFDTARTICVASTHPDRDSVLADIYFCLGSIAMDTNDFDASRVHKQNSFDLVSEIWQDLDTSNERSYLAYAERGISRIQDNRHQEGESDLKECLRIHKALGNYIPRSSVANLGWALLAQGKLEECDTLLLDSLAAREDALGKDDSESVRTGLILSVLGVLRAAQNRWDESFEYHDRAWRHMRRTVGDKDVYTARVAYKIAEHLIRLGQSDEAITMINGALEIWSVDPNAHKNEIARTTFLKAKLFESMGKSQKASIALRVAGRLRNEITREHRDMKSLTMGDFDDIVAFWCR